MSEFQQAVDEAVGVLERLPSGSVTTYRPYIYVNYSGGLGLRIDVWVTKEHSCSAASNELWHGGRYFGVGSKDEVVEAVLRLTEAVSGGI